MTMNDIPPTTPDDQPIALRLREVASWQLKSLAPLDASKEPCPPAVLAGLPSLQRGAVWRPNQIELLWDSILRGFPIGSLVACRRLSPEQQRTRSGVAAAGQAGDSKWREEQYTHHLLDGQQRANAVALGYLDPFTVPKEQSPSKTILWLDLDPSRPKENRFPAASTRHHLLRVTTEAHPWGFKVSDDKEPERLSSGDAYSAIEAFRLVHPLAPQGSNSGDGQTPEAAYSSRQRPSPCEGWPVVANAPLPLAWALLEAEKLRSHAPEDLVNEDWARRLWCAVLDRVKEVQERGRATGTEACAKVTEGNPAESTTQPSPQEPWWTKAARVLTEWTAETVSDSHRLQGLRLAQALRRAVDTQLLVLMVPQDALDAPSRLEAMSSPHPNENVNENVANLEHLFARLNNGGTSLSVDDLTYSMIKAYWPGIEQTIDGIPKRPPETQVALLGARLARAEATWRDNEKSAPNLPAAPNVSAIRQLGAARTLVAASDESMDTAQREQQREQRERRAWREQMETMFGLSSSVTAPLTAAQTPIAQALAKVEMWYGYRPKQSWGLPPVLLSRMATQSSEVYLFLLWLAHHNGTAQTPHEDIRRPLLGLATAIQWLGTNRERAIREMWKTEPDEWISGKAFSKKWLTDLASLQNANQKPDPAIAFIPTPKELDDYINERTLTKSESIKDWNWWRTLVVTPAEQEWRNDHPGQELSRQELDGACDQRWAKWAGVIKLLSARSYDGANALLLMYAQREQMHHFFSDVDTRDTGFWDKHNVPWDFDHLLQQDLLKSRWTGNYQEVYQAWGYTIANLHLLPFGLNRARGDKALEEALADWKENDWKRAILWDQKGRQGAFSMSRADIPKDDPGAIDRVHRFATEARARLLRIYRDWFDTLRVHRLL